MNHHLNQHIRLGLVLVIALFISAFFLGCSSNTQNNSDKNKEAEQTEGKDLKQNNNSDAKQNPNSQAQTKNNTDLAAQVGGNQDAQQNLEEGEAFLEENKTKEGVVTLDSGLQYKIIEPGQGESPTPSDVVTVHYAGRLLDGTEFDSSYKRNEPISFPVTGVIPGWTEALQLMKKGAKWELYIPSHLAYGPQGGGPIPPNATLLFDVELIDFENQQIAADRAQQERQQLAESNRLAGQAFLEENKKKEGVIELPSGLQYKVLEEGTGETPTANDTVSVHYEGRLLNGNVFDSSYQRNRPAEFPVTGVIPGWVEALQLMKTGAKWELYIPGDLAYGERGNRSIPPNSLLIFQVELLEIK